LVDTGAGRGASTTAQHAHHVPTGERSERPPARTPAWDLVTVPSRQGLEAVDILRLRTGVGPVLHDTSGDTLGFLVPAGTADGWDLPGSACTGTRARGRRPAAGTPAAEPTVGVGWLLPPEHGDPVTDPALLRMALGEAARTLAAARGA
jgi:hypothetical protein